MADQYYWIGTTGPFKYDDATPVNDVNLVYDGANAPDASPIITTGQLQISTAPTLGTHVLREEDIGGIVGDVSGPAGATDNAVARFDTATGKLLQDSLFIVDDTGHVSSFGGQLAFPAAQVASAGANVLDDYEENTWTPTVANMTVVGVATYSGHYTKIGNRVFFEAMIIPGTSTASTAGSTTITLPSTPGAVAAGACADAAIASLGNGVIYTDGKFYPPTWAVNTNRIYISGVYRV